MGNERFDASRSDGIHARLARMAGEWTGTTRVWFDPAAGPAMEMPQRGTLRVVLGGRFVLHEYVSGGEGHADGRVDEGIALYGMHLDAGRFETAWVDSFHTGTSILFSTEADAGTGFTALGSYSAGDGPAWGWRTRISQPSDDELLIEMTNIEPDGVEARAVETRYRRA